VELEVVDSVDIETVRKTLKKRAQTLAEAMLVQNPPTLTDRRVFTSEMIATHGEPEGLSDDRPHGLKLHLP